MSLGRVCNSFMHVEIKQFSLLFFLETTGHLPSLMSQTRSYDQELAGIFVCLFGWLVIFVLEFACSGSFFHLALEFVVFYLIVSCWLLVWLFFVFSWRVFCWLSYLTITTCVLVVLVDFVCWFCLVVLFSYFVGLLCLVDCFGWLFWLVEKEFVLLGAPRYFKIIQQQNGRIEFNFRDSCTCENRFEYRRPDSPNPTWKNLLNYNLELTVNTHDSLYFYYTSTAVFAVYCVL